MDIWIRLKPSLEVQWMSCAVWVEKYHCEFKKYFNFLISLKNKFSKFFLLKLVFNVFITCFFFSNCLDFGKFL